MSKLTSTATNIKLTFNACHFFIPGDTKENNNDTEAQDNMRLNRLYVVEIDGDGIIAQDTDWKSYDALTNALYLDRCSFQAGSGNKIGWSYFKSNVNESGVMRYPDDYQPRLTRVEIKITGATNNTRIKLSPKPGPAVGGAIKSGSIYLDDILIEKL